jgi:hypothetical protein
MDGGVERATHSLPPLFACRFAYNIFSCVFIFGLASFFFLPSSRSVTRGLQGRRGREPLGDVSGGVAHSSSVQRRFSASFF